ncbi:protein Mis18-beta [Solea solea]|uniref:protein Mis18-beta n=1 Tax=Solea solea TaxID=90069 RepID=UPI00272A7CD1|nr:protein Mis18-beta [Solea solea]
MKSLDSIVCLRTTNDVVISNEVELGHKGEIAKCIYSSLKCGGCDSAVGIVIHSAPSRLAAIRSLFLLNKANITCYILGSQSVVKVSSLSFDVKPLGPSMNMARKHFTAHLEQMTQIKRRLDNSSVNSSSDR